MKRFLTVIASLVICSSASAAPRVSPQVCVPQSTKVTGTWQCYSTTSAGSSSGQEYTFAQSGNRFYSTGETSHRLFGTIEGTAIYISEVVNGEELEGFVKYSEGHIISINDKSNNGIVTVYHDSQGGTGSFNCLKQ